MKSMTYNTLKELTDGKENIDITPKLPHENCLFVVFLRSLDGIEGFLNIHGQVDKDIRTSRFFLSLAQANRHMLSISNSNFSVLQLDLNFNRIVKNSTNLKEEEIIIMLQSKLESTVPVINSTVNKPVNKI